MKRIRFVLAALCAAGVIDNCYPLILSEIFFKAGPYVRSEERYLEIFNDTAAPVDLANVSVRVPASGTAVTDLSLQTGDFQLRQGGVVTQSLLLPPGGTAVVMTEDYRKYAKLIAFASNTVLVKPRNRAFSGWSWEDRLHQIGLVTNGIPAFSCGDYDLEAASGLSGGESLSLNGSRYVRSALNPGSWGKSRLRTDVPIAVGASVLRVSYEDPFATNDVVTAGFVAGTGLTGVVFLSPSGPGRWSAPFSNPGLPHGTDVFFYAGPNAAVARFQESRPLSPVFQGVLFNEVVSDPQTDYSGGGWTGRDGGGLVSETDEWAELVNASDQTCVLSNWHILYRSDAGESVKRMSFRSNSGPASDISVLEPARYLVVTPENGIANNARLALYDGHPWIDGRIVDEIEYGSGDLTGDGSWNNAPGGESASPADESVSRVPNGVRDPDLRRVFRKGPATFCRFNASAPVLWVRDCIGSLVHPVYYADETRSEPVVTVAVANGMDRETVVLTNAGIHFRGVINMTRAHPVPDDGVLSVRNGIKNSVRIEDHGAVLSGEFLWALEGWSVPSESSGLSSVVVYPNPAPRGTEFTLVVGNLPGGSDVFLTDPAGNTLARSVSGASGYCEFHVRLRPGFHTVSVCQGTQRAFRKVWVK